MQKLKVDFRNFWPQFDKASNIVTASLRNNYEVSIDSDTPDVIFYQGQCHSKSNSVDVSWFVESPTRIGLPNYDTCDASIGSCHYSHARHTRVPFWATQINWDEDKEDYNLDRGPTLLLDKSKLSTRRYEPRDRNISAISATPLGKRLSYYPDLSSKTHVDHAGAFLKNNNELKERVGNSDYREKIEFISKYKMNLCFENDDYPGYVCEKILHSFYANTIPIYWGPLDAVDDFNQDAFIHVSLYETDEESMEEILDILSDESIIKSMSEEPVFNDDVFPEYATPEFIGERLKEVIG